MSYEQVMEKLREVFYDVFDDENLEINENTTANDIEEWDSLEQIHIIMGCEKKFGVKFEISEVNKMKNVGEMVSLIVSKVSE